MTEHDPIEARLSELLAHETMPESCIAATIALAHAHADSKQQDEPDAAPLPAGQPVLTVIDGHRDTLRESTAPQRKRRRSRPRFAQLLAACLVTIALAAVGVASATETAQVGIEGRATAELGVNCWGRVVRVWGSDPDVENQLKGLGLIGLDCGDALEKIAEQDGGLLSDGDGVALVTSCNNSAQRQALMEDTEGASLLFGDQTTCGSYDASMRQAAREAQMGIARYAVYLEISALDPSITLDECRGLSVHELRAILSALQNGEPIPTTDQGNNAGGHGGMGGKHGNGMGHGSNGQGQGRGRHYSSDTADASS